MKYYSIAPDVRLGQNIIISEFVNLYGCSIGDNTKIGAFVEVQKNASIGRNCKIQSHTFICEGVTIEDSVFVGHGVIFINDKYPRATNGNGGLQSEERLACCSHPHQKRRFDRIRSDDPVQHYRRRKCHHRIGQRRHEGCAPEHSRGGSACANRPENRS